MAAGTLVSVEEYVDAHDAADCDCVDGVIEARNVRVQKKIHGYLAFGVADVRLIDPRRGEPSFTHPQSYEVKDGILRTENREMVVPLAEVFASLE